MVTELTDPIVRELIPARDCPHPLVHGLTADAPVEAGSHQAAQMLERWRTSLAADEPELVLRLLEPDADDTDEVALWRLEVCLRVDGRAPTSVPLHGDPQLVRAAVERLGEAQRAYPRLRDLPGDPRTMDLLLPTEVVVDLVAHGVHALQEAGIRLLLPRAWTVTAPTMRLRVNSAVPAAESTVGLPGLVSYRWELALGDTVLSRDEMQRLIHAKSIWCSCVGSGCRPITRCSPRPRSTSRCMPRTPRSRWPT